MPSLSSRERKWTRPDPSPANTQQRAGASQVKVAITVPVAKSHTLSVWSSEAETACIPSGVTATAFTWPLWPGRVRSSRPLARSQTLSVFGKRCARSAPSSQVYEIKTGCGHSRDQAASPHGDNGEQVRKYGLDPLVPGTGCSLSIRAIKWIFTIRNDSSDRSSTSDSRDCFGRPSHPTA